MRPSCPNSNNHSAKNNTWRKVFIHLLFFSIKVIHNINTFISTGLNATVLIFSSIFCLMVLMLCAICVLVCPIWWWTVTDWLQVKYLLDGEVCLEQQLNLSRSTFLTLFPHIKMWPKSLKALTVTTIWAFIFSVIISISVKKLLSAELHSLLNAPFQNIGSLLKTLIENVFSFETSSLADWMNESKLGEVMYRILDSTSCMGKNCG